MIECHESRLDYIIMRMNFMIVIVSCLMDQLSHSDTLTRIGFHVLEKVSQPKGELGIATMNHYTTSLGLGSMRTIFI